LPPEALQRLSAIKLRQWIFLREIDNQAPHIGVRGEVRRQAGDAPMTKRRAISAGCDQLGQDFHMTHDASLVGSRDIALEPRNLEEF
jgi:hypothetical protein